MGTYFKAIDRFAAALTRTVIARRWLVIAGAVALAAVVGSGASRLEFSTNYRVFFSEANPELQAFEFWIAMAGTVAFAVTVDATLPPGYTQLIAPVTIAEFSDFQ